MLLLHFFNEVEVCEDFVVTFDKLYKLRPGVCDTSGWYYLPGNMAGQWQTMEASPQRCQQRCKDTPGCKYFTSYTDGGCHITTGEEGANQGHSAVSGTRFCDVEGSNMISSPFNFEYSATKKEGFWSSLADGMALNDVKDCDQSIDLLLGKMTSIGTLQDIVSKVTKKKEENAADFPNYMPGEFCVSVLMFKYLSGRLWQIKCLNSHSFLGPVHHSLTQYSTHNILATM